MCSMSSSFPMMPVELPMGLTGRATPPPSVRLSEELPPAPAPHHSESAVSSPSLAAAHNCVDSLGAS